MPANFPISPVPYTSVLERPDLLEAHYEELATDKARMELAPFTEAYAQLDANGALFTLGMFDQGEMIGYSANFMAPAMHYRHLVVCQNDVLFLAKPYRNGRNGRALIDATEAEATRRGAGMMTWHAKPNTPLAAMLRRYRVQDIVFSKGL